MATKRDHEIAAKWIKEMQGMGFTPDQMLKVIRMAREKYKAMKAKQQAICLTLNYRENA